MPELQPRSLPRAARRTALAAVLAAAALLVAGAWSPAPAAAEPAESGLAVPLHEAIYHASVRRIPVRAGLRLERQGEGLYVYRSWVEPRGMLGFIRRELYETSLIRLEADRSLTPLSYRRRDELGGRDSDMVFDPVAGKVRIDYRDEVTVSDWEPGIYDLLSLRLVIAHDLARGALQDVYRVIDDRSRVDDVDVEVVGRESLDTALGRLETIRLEYRSQRRDRLFRIWIAPDMHAALIRLEQYEAGQLRGSLNIVEYRPR